jgi:hypothetical protein
MGTGSQSVIASRLELRAVRATAAPVPGELLLDELEPISDAYPRGIHAALVALRLPVDGDGDAADAPLVGAFRAVSGSTPLSPDTLAGARGALMVVSANTDPGRDADFARWYDEVHLPDVVAAGGYRAAARYVGQVGHGGPQRSLAVYLTDEDPIAAHQRVQAAFATMRMWPAIDVHHVRDYAVTSGPA